MSHIIRELFEAVVLALLVFFVIQISIQNFRVEGLSMRPTLEEKQYLMVNKLSYLRVDLQRLSRLIPFWSVENKDEKYVPFAHSPERGDIIVFREPVREDRDFVKRVIGLPGERIEIHSGSVFIDGAELDEPYLADTNLSGEMKCIPRSTNCRLGSEQYFVLGDNRPNSNDSRAWGAVPEENIIGKVWFVYWPLCEAPLIGDILGGCDS